MNAPSHSQLSTLQGPPVPARPPPPAAPPSSAWQPPGHLSSASPSSSVSGRPATAAAAATAATAGMKELLQMLRMDDLQAILKSLREAYSGNKGIKIDRIIHCFRRLMSEGKLCLAEITAFLTSAVRMLEESKSSGRLLAFVPPRPPALLPTLQIFTPRATAPAPPNYAGLTLPGTQATAPAASSSPPVLHSNAVPSTAPRTAPAPPNPVYRPNFNDLASRLVNYNRGMMQQAQFQSRLGASQSPSLGGSASSASSLPLSFEPNIFFTKVRTVLSPTVFETQLHQTIAVAHDVIALLRCGHKLIVRLCPLEKAATKAAKLPHTTHSRVSYICVDARPVSLVVSVNSIPAYKFEAYSKDTLRKPLDVTQIVLGLSGNNHSPLSLHLIANSPTLKKIVATVELVTEVLSSELIGRVSRASFDACKSTITQRYTNAASGDIEIPVEVKLSLLCPLTKQRLVAPARGTKCLHAECFELSVYILLNEKSSRWKCPLCGKDLPYEELLVDEFVHSILATTPPSVTEVVLNCATGDVRPVLAQPALEVEKSRPSSPSAVSAGSGVDGAVGGAHRGVSRKGKQPVVIDLTDDSFVFDPSFFASMRVKQEPGTAPVVADEHRETPVAPDPDSPPAVSQPADVSSPALSSPAGSESPASTKPVFPFPPTHMPPTVGPLVPRLAPPTLFPTSAPLPIPPVPPVPPIDRPSPIALAPSSAPAAAPGLDLDEPAVLDSQESVIFAENDHSQGSEQSSRRRMSSSDDDDDHDIVILFDSNSSNSSSLVQKRPFVESRNLPQPKRPRFL